MEEPKDITMMARHPEPRLVARVLRVKVIGVETRGMLIMPVVVVVPVAPVPMETINLMVDRVLHVLIWELISTGAAVVAVQVIAPAAVMVVLAAVVVVQFVLPPVVPD